MKERIRRLLGKKAEASKILLSLVFISLVIIPLFRMFLNIDRDSIQKVFTSANFGKVICNSLLATGIATVITVIIAYLLALCISRTDIRFKKFFRIIFVLPMLIPSISIGMGLIILFGNNGLVTNVFHMDSGIYGLGGVILGSVLYAFPVAFLMLDDVMKYEDMNPYEAAQVLGISKLRQFKEITLPYLRKPLISVVFSTFTLIISDYGVPLMVGGKYTTVPVVMYQEVIGQLNFGKGAVYGSLLLIPAIAAFVIDLMNKDKGNSAYVVKQFVPKKNRIRNLVSYVYCGILTVFTALPLLAFVVLAFAKDYPKDYGFTFKNVLKTLKLRADEYLVNSIVIALAVAIIGCAVAFMTAYMSARMKSKASKFLHLSAITSAAIPGVVLGLAYVLTFSKTPLYGTVVILIMVNLVHFIASPYLMMYNSLSKINENLEDVGHIMGISRGYMIKDVFIPQCKYTLMEMFSYFFVNCMMTISAVSFLATTANKPVALMINQFEAQMQLEYAAVVSLAILLINLVIKGVIGIISNKSKNGVELG